MPEVESRWVGGRPGAGIERNGPLGNVGDGLASAMRRVSSVESAGRVVGIRAVGKWLRADLSPQVLRAGCRSGAGSNDNGSDGDAPLRDWRLGDRKSTRLNSSH